VKWPKAPSGNHTDRSPYKLNNLIGVLDVNLLGQRETMWMDLMSQRTYLRMENDRADGHSILEILAAYGEAARQGHVDRKND
jgi:hypothetical protein